MFLVLGAFIAGVLTVLAPCVLPLLPIIIGGSVTGNTKDKKRPLVIAASLAVSLLVFTLLLKATTLLIHVPPRAIGYISGTIIMAVGAVLLLPRLYALAIAKLGIEQRAQRFLGAGYKNKRHLLGPIIIGAALGPVFSSCSPVYAYILATVLPVHFAQAVVYILAYVLGLSLVLLLIGYYGQRFTAKIRFASNPNGWFQRSVAVVFIVVGLFVFTGYDKTVQIWVSAHVFNFDKISSSLLPSTHQQDNSALYNIQPFPAPEFVGLQSWINSAPLTMQSLRGKVVLVDFWTYSCINCLRNNPYIERWYQAYKDDGLVVVGVHAPEFAFEQVPANVQKAVKNLGITYPVALDNNLATWNAFSNRSWPASYLINQQGQVVRIHEGEGDYQQEEQAIRQLLVQGGAKLGAMTTTGSETVPIAAQQTPETYFGTARASDYVGSPDLAVTARQTFTLPAALGLNGWALGGSWQVAADKVTAAGKSSLAFHVAAKDVYVVAGSSAPSDVTVEVDGQPVAGSGLAGPDVHGSTLTIDGPRLYHVLSFPGFTSDHTVKLTVPDGVELNTFTFGS